MRAHVVLPPEIVRDIDAIVGKRRRSAFLLQAVQEKLRSIKLASAAESAAGSLPADAVPEWSTGETSARWVRALREADAKRLGHIAQS